MALAQTEKEQLRIYICLEFPRATPELLARIAEQTDEDIRKRLDAFRPKAIAMLGREREALQSRLNQVQDMMATFKE
ncbi:MAG TPA: hypothetical protein VM487_10900 [Phycisphaerae bacterium]|nr:hypothetical protein [Phycisphaerae bacterium]